MNFTYNELNTASQALPIDMGVKRKVLAAGVGIAVASRLPLPSGDTPDLSSYFNLYISDLIAAPVSDIGESVVMDARAAVEYARMYWMLRAAQANPIYVLQFAENTEIGFFDTLFGCNLHVSEADRCFLNEYKNSIFRLAFLALRLIDQNGKQDVGAQALPEVLA